MLYNDNVNTNNSIIKSAIDYWYENEMTNFTDYLEDTVWCNDRSFVELGTWNPNSDNLKNLRFKSYSNLKDLTCKNKNDRFTVNEANGNGALTYPVGLIDATEGNLAYDNSSNPSSPHDSKQFHWEDLMVMMLLDIV